MELPDSDRGLARARRRHAEGEPCHAVRVGHHPFPCRRPFITAMPRSVAHFKSLKVLPVDLPARPWPVNIVTLKNRTLSTAAERFIECARDFTRPLRSRLTTYLAVTSNAKRNAG